MLKIVVVEDEPHILSGISKLIKRLNPQHQIVGEARNGAIGRELILRLQPNLVITDIRMPEMDGLEMFRQLRKEGVQSEFILLTGHSDFHYVREALKLGSVDYLLKPTVVADLKKAIEQAQERITESENHIPLSDYSAHHLLHQIISGSREQVDPFLEALRGRLTGSIFACLLLHNDHTVTESKKKLFMEAVQTVFNQPNQQYAWSILDVLNEILLIVQGQDTKQLQKRMETLWAHFNQEETFDFSGCLEYIDDLAAMRSRLPGMRDTLQWAISFPPQTLLSRELVASTRFANLTYPSHIEASVLAKIRAGKLTEIQSDLEALFVHLSKDRYPYLQLRESMLCFSSSILFSIRKHSFSIFTELSQMQIDEMSRQTHSLQSFITVLINGINQYEFSSRSLIECENPIIHKVLRIISEEYDQDISLEFISDRLHLTTEYLSTLFKKETGVNFSIYLPQFRIERAKELMNNPNNKIYTIAEKSGYRDTAYFCKVFKRITGLSPKEYMKSVI